MIRRYKLLLLTRRNERDRFSTASVHTVHTRYASTVIDRMCFRIDTRCFTITFAQTALVTLVRINPYLEQRIVRYEAQHRADRTNRIAIRPPVTPCENSQHNQRHKRNNQYHNPFIAYHINGIEGITIYPFGKMGQQVIAHSVNGSKQPVCDTSVSAVR